MATSGKQIKDPVHGYITVSSELVNNIVDTHLFQRLRNLRQMDTTRAVYPSANHTRFEHTLGVFHLAKRAFDRLKRSDNFQTLNEETVNEMEQTIKCASLCHDIGHFPFSHLGESFCDESEIRTQLEESDYDLHETFEEAGIRARLDEAAPHELMSCLIVLSEYGDDIDSLDANPIEVCAFILGGSIHQDEWQWQAVADLIHSHIDVDRLDYMIRDDFMSGASLVVVDSNRMIDAYTTVDNTLALSEKAHSTIGNYLQGRNSVYLWIAQHHKVVYSNIVVKELIRELSRIKTSGDPESDDNPLFNINQILEYGIDDAYLLEKIRSNAISGESNYLENLYRQYRSREFLGSCWKHVVDFNRKIQSDAVQSRLLESIIQDGDELREDIMTEFDLERHEVLAGESYVPGYEQQDLNEIFIDYQGSARKISALDLYDTQEELFRSIPYLFVPQDYTSSVVSYIKDEYPPVPGV